MDAPIAESVRATLLPDPPIPVGRWSVTEYLEDPAWQTYSRVYAWAAEVTSAKTGKTIPVVYYINCRVASVDFPAVAVRQEWERRALKILTEYVEDATRGWAYLPPGTDEERSAAIRALGWDGTAQARGWKIPIMPLVTPIPSLPEPASQSRQERPQPLSATCCGHPMRQAPAFYGWSCLGCGRKLGVKQSRARVELASE